MKITLFVVNYVPSPSYLPNLPVYGTSSTSVAEPPLFWAAPAPEVRGPGAGSEFDHIGTAPPPRNSERYSLRLF